MSRLDRAFRRYCATRDPRALAFVFDRTAPQLMSLARYLAGSAAEDVVQDTFLVAIGRAGSFMPEARVLPWLAGILVLKAKEARRSRRTPAEMTPPSDSAPPPDALAAQTELHAHLHAALARLPARYRDVVTPMLQEGLAPEDVARRLARNPSTVRTQLARGLEHLRRLLPAGSAVAVAAPAPAAIARVRQEVLSAGGGEVAVASGAGALSVVAAVMLVGAGVTAALMWQASEAARQREVAEVAAALAAERAAVLRDGGEAADDHLAADAQAAAPARTPVEGESRPSPAAGLVDVTGVCVDAATGQPIADCEVTARGLGSNDVARLVHGDSAWRDPEPVRTGVDGRFVHRVDPTPAMQYVIEARAAGRAALGCWFLGSAAAAGLDLGPLRLERGHGLSGRVVDETGRPVPGLFVSFYWHGVVSRERDESASMAFEADAEGTWQRRSDNWPLLPARRFHFSPGFGQPSDSYSLGDSDVLPHTTPEAALAADGTIRLDLVVRRPREIAGRVVDEHDVAVTDVVVVADATPGGYERRRTRDGGAFAFRARADRTGTVQLRVEGDFDTLQPTEAIAWGTTDVQVRVRRRAPSSPSPPAPRPTVQLDVVDAVTGAPVGRYGLQVHPPQPPGGMAHSGRLVHAGDHPDGRLEVQDIPSGTHYLEVIPGRGHETTFQNIEVPREGRVSFRVAVLPVTFARLTVRVERPDGATIAGADVEVIEVLPGKTIDAESMLKSPLGFAFGHDGNERGRGRTGPGGECAIEVTRRHGFDTFTLRVRTPGLPPAIAAGVHVPDQHGRAVVVVDEGAELRVRLDPPSLGLLAPRLRLLSPSNRLVTSGTPAHSGAGNPFAPDGTLVVRGLPAGDVQPELVVVVTVGFDIPHRLELLPTVALRTGQVTEIVARAPRFTPGRIRGRVVRQGQATWVPATELMLEGHFTGEAVPPIPAIVRPTHGPFRTAADGTFDIAVPPGRYRLREMQAPAGQTAAVSIEEVEVAPDRTVEQTFVLR